MKAEHNKINFDVLFVGGGPASLASAIHLMQSARKKNIEIEVALIEKGSEIGSHALSGAVLDPVALKEIMPDFKERGCPIEATVRGDEFCFLTPKKYLRIPFTPRHMRNKGFYTISLSRFTKWLGEVAEALGVNIFPGFAGEEVLYAEDQETIIGVRTGDKGIGSDGEPKGNFEPGIDLMAKVTVFGEGARGNLIKDIGQKLNIFSGKMPQVFETGIKEVIQLPEKNYFTTSSANAIHIMGYPLGIDTPGGGFIYQMGDNRVAIGLLVGLCYDEAELDPYASFIKFKRHPFVAKLLKDGRVVEQGARTVCTGGYYSIPQLEVSGGLFVGGCASIHNTPALKGIHVSMKSGMLAAEAILYAIERKRFTRETLDHYSKIFKNSWCKAEMVAGRNFSQALARKGLVKFIHLGAQYLTRGRGIVDKMPLEQDCDTLKPLQKGQNLGRPVIDNQAYDGVLYVDKLTGVYLSKTHHREDQPSHILIHDVNLCIDECYPKFGSPCTRFCPANVYEIETEENTSKRRLKLNPSNCLHCKTCDIKDPYNNISWTCPEGGDGPDYSIV